MTYPGTSVLEGHPALGSPDQVIWKSCPLHDVVNLVILEADGQLDVALELTFGLAHGTLGSPTSVARPTPGREGEGQEIEGLSSILVLKT